MPTKLVTKTPNKHLKLETNLKTNSAAKPKTNSFTNLNLNPPLNLSPILNALLPLATTVLLARLQVFLSLELKEPTLPQ